MSEEASFWLRVAAAFGAVFALLIALIYVATAHDQRACTESCIESGFRPSAKACAFYCAWDRPKPGGDPVVVVPIPVIQP